MTLPSWPRTVGERRHPGTQETEGPHGPTAEARLEDLLREEDRKPETLEPARELQRRAAPSGE
jgi:hypothetical protein